MGASGAKGTALAGYGRACARIAETVMEDGARTRDLAMLRQAAREMLVQALSCREGHSQSGMGARYAGAAIGADLYLPDMATQDFPKTLSRAAIERATSAERVTPRNTARETRAALIAHAGNGTYVHPAARFAPSEAELAACRSPGRSVQAGDEGTGDPEALDEEGREDPGDGDAGISWSACGDDDEDRFLIPCPGHRDAAR